MVDKIVILILIAVNLLVGSAAFALDPVKPVTPQIPIKIKPGQEMPPSPNPAPPIVPLYKCVGEAKVCFGIGIEDCNDLRVSGRCKGPVTETAGSGGELFCSCKW